MGSFPWKCIKSQWEILSGSFYQVENTPDVGGVLGAFKSDLLSAQRLIQGKLQADRTGDKAKSTVVMFNMVSVNLHT